MGDSPITDLEVQDRSSSSQHSPPAKRARVASPTPPPNDPPASTTKPRKVATDLFGSADQPTARTTRSKAKPAPPAVGYDNLPSINDTHLAPEASSAASGKADEAKTVKTYKSAKAAAKEAKAAAKAAEVQARRDAKGKGRAPVDV